MLSQTTNNKLFTTVATRSTKGQKVAAPSAAQLGDAAATVGDTSSRSAWQPVQVERDTLQNQIYHQLREAMRSGRFAPGFGISLREAAAIMGTSLVPVRGALQRLEVEGALLACGPRGVLMIPALSAEEMLELRNIRIALEGMAAERAARLRQPAHIEQAQQCYEKMVQATQANDVDGYVQANWSLHVAIYKASGTPRLLNMIEGMWLRVGPYVRWMMPDQAHMQDSLPHHADMVQALRDGNAKAARRAIEQDIREAAESFIAFLADSAQGTPTPQSKLTPQGALHRPTAGLNTKAAAQAAPKRVSPPSAPVRQPKAKKVARPAGS